MREREEGREEEQWLGGARAPSMHVPGLPWALFLARATIGSSFRVVHRDIRAYK